MAVELLPLDKINDTWGDAVDRINQIITVIGEQTLTANSDPTIGDSILDGSFYADTIYQANTKVVPESVAVVAGTGLSGGGALTANVTFNLTSNTLTALTKANTAVQAVVAGNNVTINSANTFAPVVSASFGTFYLTTSIYDPQNKATDAFARANHTGYMPLSGLAQGTSGSFVVGRTAASGNVDRITISTDETANTVPLRSSTGTLTANTPTAGTHVANKTYVDGGDATKAGIITTLTVNSTAIPLSDDLNTYTTTGIYYNSGVPTGNNYPVAIRGTLEVINANSSITQRYTTYRYNTTDFPYIFIRNSSGGTWSAWQNISAPIVNSTAPSNPAEGTIWFKI